MAVSKAPEVDISASALRLKLSTNSEFSTLAIPENALPLDPDVARCTFSKRRGELVVEWPCSVDETPSNEVAKPEEVTVPAAAASAEEVVPAAATSPEEVQEDEHSSASCAVTEPMISEAVMPEEPMIQDAVLPEDDVSPEEQDPESSVTADEWKARGNDAVKTGDIEAAIQCYSSGITKAAKDCGDREAEGVLCSNRALCFHKLGRYQEAVDDAMRCVALKPKFVKGFLRGAMALRALVRPAEALALLKRAPVNDEACSLAAEIRPEAEAAEKARIEALPEAERAKEEGNVLFRKALFEQATEKYGEALGLCEEPEGALALSIRNNRAACNHQISDFHAVIKDTNFVLEREPQNFKALSRRMLALEPLERYEQALQDARGVLSQDPRNEVANKVQHRLGKLVRDLKRANGGV